MVDVIIPTIVKPLTFERYADVSIPGGASYTPTKAGFFSWGMELYFGVSEYYSTVKAAWFSPMQAWLTHVGKSSDYNSAHQEIGDGTNYRIRNNSTVYRTLTLMRVGYSTPNPSPSIGKQKMYGKTIIVLESDEKGFIWIEEEKLTKPCEDVFPEAEEALIGKTLTQAIKEDVEDKMGYGKYKALLQGLGYDV